MIFYQTSVFIKQQSTYLPKIEVKLILSLIFTNLGVPKADKVVEAGVVAVGELDEVEFEVAEVTARVVSAVDSLLNPGVFVVTGKL